MVEEERSTVETTEVSSQSTSEKIIAGSFNGIKLVVKGMIAVSFGLVKTFYDYAKKSSHKERNID